MKARVERTPQVAVDLDEIWLAIAADNERAADRVLSRIVEAAYRLGEFPEMGQARSELRLGLRGWTVGEYVIFYSFEPDVVTILRVVHGTRELGDLLSDS